MAAGEKTETRGADSKLTLARLETIRDLVRNGNYLSVAAEAAGVSERTVYRWLEQGEQPEEAEQDTLHWQFCQAVRKAQAEAEQLLVAAIERAASGYKKKTTKTRTFFNEQGVECTETTIEEAEVFDWRAAAWMLQARHKQRWAQNPPPAVEAEQENVKVLIIGEAPPTGPPQIEQGPPGTVGEVLGV